MRKFVLKGSYYEMGRQYGQYCRKDIKLFIDEVTKQLKAKGVTGKAKQIGRKTYPLTEEWKQYGTTNRTPKTDIMIGADDISMKLKPSAMLMSGGKSEAQATFMNVVDNITSKPDLQTLIDRVKDEFEEFKIPPSFAIPQYALDSYKNLKSQESLLNKKPFYLNLPHDISKCTRRSDPWDDNEDEYGEY